MDLFFGLEKPALNEEGVAHLATLYDDISVGMYEALLKEESIAYLKKDRSGGTAVRILMGNNPHGTDIYVAEADLERARALFTLDETDVIDDNAESEDVQ